MLPDRRRRPVVPPSRRAAGSRCPQGVRRAVGDPGRQPDRPPLPVAALRHGDRVDLEPRAGRSARGGAGRRSTLEARPRGAGTDGLHRAHAPGRPHLRVLLRGPAPDGPPRRRLRAGGAGGRGRVLHQALRLQRPGARTDDHQRRGLRARSPGDPPRRLRSRRPGGRRLVRDDRLQQGQRDLLRRAARPDRADLAGRVGLRRRRHVGLVRHALDRAGGARRARSRDAGPARLVRPLPGRRRPRRDRRRVGGRRAGAPPAAPDGSGRPARRGERRGDRGAGGGRPRAPGARPRGGGRGDGPAGEQRPAPPVRRRDGLECRGHRTEREPAGGGRGQLGGDPAPAAQHGRRAGRAAVRHRRHLGGGLPYRARAAPDRHASRWGGVHGGVLRRRGSADNLVGARRGGVGARGPDHVDRSAATGPGGRRLRRAHPRQLQAGRARRVAARARERRALRTAPRRRRAHRQHRSFAWSRFLRRRERTGRSDRRPRCRPHLRARRRGLAPDDVLPHPRCADRRVAARHR